METSSESSGVLSGLSETSYMSSQTDESSEILSRRAARMEANKALLEGAAQMGDMNRIMLRLTKCKPSL